MYAICTPSGRYGGADSSSWWDQLWPNEEYLWPARLEATRPAGADPVWWKVAARDLITYPETVVLARLLADRTVQERTATASRRHLPYRLGELPGLLAELADQLGRPWLAHHLATVTHGPLFTWGHSCVHAPTAPVRRHCGRCTRPTGPVPSATSSLTPRPPMALRPHQGPPARQLRGHSLQAEQAFRTGLAQAHAYHQLHGHLAVPKEDTPAGYPLGHGGRVPRRGRQRRRPRFEDGEQVVRVRTDDSGKATAPTLTAGEGTDTYTVAASVGDAMTQFAVEVVAGDGPSASPSPSPSTSISGTSGGTDSSTTGGTSTDLDHGRHVDGPRQRQPRLDRHRRHRPPPRGGRGPGHGGLRGVPPRPAPEAPLARRRVTRRHST
ncbi:helicase associated domain-containing protein [Streptomyces sp. NPDC093808]|uniref:helicase associated domain-containing protein n=2 Tax=Streptomyces TaxID=1883 RepID=UPI003450435A